MEMREGNQQEREAKLIGFERSMKEIKAKWAEFDRQSCLKKQKNRVLFGKTSPGTENPVGH